MTEKKENGLKFEKGLARLEQLVEDLESEELDLERSLSLFEEGIKLARNLNNKLDQAEKKLELLYKNEAGEPEIETLSLTPNELEDN